MAQIIGLRRLDKKVYRMGGNGDNWYMTWARNGRQYVSLNDGRGWPDVAGYTGKVHNTRVFALDGDPPEVRFEYLDGFCDLMSGDTPLTRQRYYGFGILALDDSLYHYLATPNHMFQEPGARFVGAKLIYSPDCGTTWKNQDGSELTWELLSQRSRQNMVFYHEPDDAFSLISILQMGKNYEHNRDGYVYLYSPNGHVEGQMNQLAMVRVPRQRILDRSAYEFFVSVNADDSANWTSQIDRRGVVHTFPGGWVNRKLHPYAWQPSVVYNAPLDVYMMSSWGMATDADGLWFARPSYLGFWVAPQPWGPWRQVHEDTAWMPEQDPDARAYQPQIAPRWISADGLSFWLVLTDFRVENKRLTRHYDFSYHKVEILTQ